jgi:dipeptidyl aminopeptidase/acylaminoacyl peptidase
LLAREPAASRLPQMSISPQPRAAVESLLLRRRRVNRVHADRSRGNLASRLANERGKGLRILDVETGQITVLTDGIGNKDNFPTWSPKGDEISFSSDREDADWEIYAIRPDGTGLRRITHPPRQ